LAWTSYETSTSHPTPCENPPQDNEKDDDSLDGYYLWIRILEKYCSTKPSSGKDKLVAISGLAEYMQTLLNYRYVAGLWESILPSQLLWRVENFTPMNALNFDEVSGNPKHPFSTRPAELTAPTWSWASVNDSITASKPMRDFSLTGVDVVDLDKGEDIRYQKEAKLWYKATPILQTWRTTQGRTARCCL
jgi:hypothetical protein